MMIMNKTPHILQHIVIMTACILLTLIGCKSPIDLDKNVNEVSLPTQPVEMNSMRFAIDGGGRSMRWLQSGPPEESRFSFKTWKIEHIHIDTTKPLHLTLAMKYGIFTDISDSSRFEEILPYSLDYEVDTTIIPIFDSPPMPREKKAVTLKKSSIKTYIFSKKKDGPNGVRMVRTEKEFDLLEDSKGDNHSDTYVYAIRTRLQQGKTMITVVIESGFTLNSAEIESFDRKFPSNASGRSSMRISF